MALRLATLSAARPAALPTTTHRTLPTRPAPAAAAAAAGDAPTPSSSSDDKGFAAAIAATQSKARKGGGAVKKDAARPPAKGAKKVRSAGRGALARTEQGARLGLGVAKKGASAAPPPSAPAGPGEWVRLAEVGEWRPGKAGKAVTLPDGTVLCLFFVADPGGGAAPRAYATEMYSSAFKYPLVDAEAVVDGRSARVTVPFDGTVYDLATGAVLDWCPGNTPVRALLGAVKSRVEPAPIRVYPARVGGDGKGVEVWFAR